MGAGTEQEPEVDTAKACHCFKVKGSTQEVPWPHIFVQTGASFVTGDSKEWQGGSLSGGILFVLQRDLQVGTAATTARELHGRKLKGGGGGPGPGGGRAHFPSADVVACMHGVVVTGVVR